MVANKGLPLGPGGGVTDPVVGDDPPVLAPMAVHHFPEYTAVYCHLMSPHNGNCPEDTAGLLK